MKSINNFSKIHFFAIVYILLSNSFTASLVSAEPVFVGRGKACDNVNTFCYENSFLECNSESKCTCLNADKSVYDPYDKKCYLNLHASCIRDEKAQPCLTMGTCKRAENDIEEHTCECGWPWYTEAKEKDRCILTYGQQCFSYDPKEQCDPRAFMKCDPSGKCVCDSKADPKGWYEKATKSCVHLQGEECKPGAGDDEQQCMEASECTETMGKYTCQCTNGVINPIDQKCVSHHGDNCGTSWGKCKTEEFLECNSLGKCECSGDNVWYNVERDKCTLKIDSPCTVKGRPCVPFAFCPKDAANPVCTCLPGLKKNKNGFCFLEYGAECEIPLVGYMCDRTSFQECDHSTKKCVCQYPSLSHWEDGECKLKADVTCDPNSPSAQKCVKNSKCEQNSTAARFKCTCDEPLEPNSNSLCVLKLNQTCDASASEPDLCDPATFLGCSKEGKCDCKSPSSLNGFGKCTLKMDQPCTAGDGNIPCEMSLSCLEGKCSCDGSKGLEDNGHGRCRRLYGKPCNIDDGYEGLCDADDDFLTCSEGTCTCDSQHRVTDGGQPCVGNLNAACKTSANCNEREKHVCDQSTKMCVRSGADIIFLHFSVALLPFLLSFYCL